MSDLRRFCSAFLLSIIPHRCIRNLVYGPWSNSDCRPCRALLMLLPLIAVVFPPLRLLKERLLDYLRGKRFWRHEPVAT